MTLIHAVSGECRDGCWTERPKGRPGGKRASSDTRQCHLKCGYEGGRDQGAKRAPDDEISDSFLH